MKSIKHTVAPSTDNQPLNAGFTLIELMVTIVVLAVIVSIASPSISIQLANARIKSTASTLSNALAEAKSESVILRKSVMVSYNNNSDAVGVISIEVEAPNFTAYAGPALYFTKPPTETGSGSGETGTGETGTGGTGTGTGGTGTGGTDTGGTGTGGTGTGGTGSGGTGSGGTGTGGTGTGGTGTGGTGSGGTGTGGTGTGGTGTGGTGTIPAPVVSYGVVKVYDYSAKTTIKASNTATIFRPNKNVDPALTYTICDVNTSAKAMQVTVSSVGIITKKVGGSCTAS